MSSEPERDRDGFRRWPDRVPWKTCQHQDRAAVKVAGQEIVMCKDCLKALALQGDRYVAQGSLR